ncbi:MAG: energy-coupling factor transporter ATPase [Oscillospiraceae bacterium]|jgi:energy-coupling factor transport system ATP-binding protein|nr:energy-coupling factor transporter ATPase [Oscillospiraceae bacterium]
MPPVIETRNIAHTYSVGTPFEHDALRGVDFAAERGEYIGIIGQTGSGKSTFIQHLNGLLKPKSGTILLDGADIHETKEATRRARFRVGLVFQFPEYQLFEETVARDIAFGPRNMGLKQPEIDERVREAAGFVGLTPEQLEKSPFDLSGGQKRRAAIAGVIAMRPEVLILDEPTAGLDPRGRGELLANIDAYREGRGATVIVVTHSMEEVARRAGRICVFSDGKIVLQGAPAEIFEHSAALLEMGLDIPVAARVANRLRGLGVPLPRGVFTTSGLRDAILAARPAQ